MKTKTKKKVANCDCSRCPYMCKDIHGAFCEKLQAYTKDLTKEDKRSFGCL